MNIKINAAFSRFVKELRLTLQSLTKVNNLAKEVDPWVIRWTWISATWGGLMTLGVFTIFGQVYSKGVSGYFDHGKVTVSIVVFAVIAIALWRLAESWTRTLAVWRRTLFDSQMDDVIDELFIKHMKKLDLGRLLSPEFNATKEDAEEKGQNAVVRLWDSQRHMLSAAIGLLASTGVILLMDPIVIIIAALPVIPSIAQAIWSDKKRRELWNDHRLIRRRRRILSACLDRPRLLIQVRLLGMVEQIWNRYRHLTTEVKDGRRMIERKDALSEMFVDAFSAASIAAAIAYIGWKLTNSSVGAAEIFLLFGAIRTFSNSLYGVGHAATQMYQHHLDFRYLEDFLATTPMINEDSARDVALTRTPQLRLRKVSFGYPESSKVALQGVDLTINPGEKVAIVGRNGDGKTTVVRLLGKVYAPTAGSVEIDKLGLSEITQKSWHKHLLFATQGATIPEFEIDFAITGESDRSRIDYTALKTAARITGADEFIEQLPHGYSSQIGEEWPGGVGFSTGQMQRLSLAAAAYKLLRQETYVGIFDEPMATCDFETRMRFYRRITDMPDKTIIVVLHDPLFLGNFERVILMEQGRIVRDLRGQQQVEAYKETIVEYLQKEQPSSEE